MCVLCVRAVCAVCTRVCTYATMYESQRTPCENQFPLALCGFPDGIQIVRQQYLNPLSHLKNQSLARH